MLFLITGGAGFIGSNLAGELVRRGEDVRILDDFSTGREDNIASFRDKIEVIKGDVTDFRTAMKAADGIDCVFHLAAKASVELSIADPVGTSQVNINGTLNFLEAARRQSVGRFVFSSSAAVYGNLPELPKSEDSELQVLSPYAAAKLTSEHFCRMYGDLYGLETVSLRYFNVFGPNQDPQAEYSAVIPKFINAVLCGKQPAIFGDGKQSRDFVFVDNVVAANLLAAESRDAVGRTFNVACGRRFTLIDLLDVLTQIAGAKAEPRFEKEKPGDIRHSVADVSRIKNQLDFDISVDFEEGLKRTMEYFKTKLSENVLVK